MKAKNTIDNKISLFNAYIGCGTFDEDGWPRWGSLKGMIGEKAITGYCPDDEEITESYDIAHPGSKLKLHLRAVSDITDGDTKKIAQLFDIGHLQGALPALITDILLAIDKNGSSPSIGSVSSWNEVIDFLRSRGYAIPWHGISVIQLVKFGWVKLREVAK